jgi:translation initiation factor IF-3
MDARLSNFSKEKEQRIRKAHQHVVEIKGIRLSLRIGAHDLEIRKDQTLKFLNNGDKVKIEIMLRGREMQQTALAFDNVRKFIESVNSEVPVRTEQPTEKQGNKITAIIAKA